MARYRYPPLYRNSKFGVAFGPDPEIGPLSGVPHVMTVTLKTSPFTRVSLSGAAVTFGPGVIGEETVADAVVTIAANNAWTAALVAGEYEVIVWRDGYQWIVGDLMVLNPVGGAYTP